MNDIRIIIRGTTTLSLSTSRRRYYVLLLEMYVLRPFSFKKFVDIAFHCVPIQREERIDASIESSLQLSHSADHAPPGSPAWRVETVRRRSCLSQFENGLTRGAMQGEIRSMGVFMNLIILVDDVLEYNFLSTDSRLYMGKYGSDLHATHRRRVVYCGEEKIC